MASSSSTECTLYSSGSCSCFKCTHTCDYCSKTFLSLNDLVIHVSAVHRNVGLNILCDKFYSPSGLLESLSMKATPVKCQPKPITDSQSPVNEKCPRMIQSPFGYVKSCFECGQKCGIEYRKWICKHCKKDNGWLTRAVKQHPEIIPPDCLTLVTRPPDSSNCWLCGEKVGCSHRLESHLKVRHHIE